MPEIAARPLDVRRALARREQLARIADEIHRCAEIPQIITSVRPKLLELFEVERATIWALDSRRNEVYSLYSEGDAVREVRLPRSSQSHIGHVATTQQTLNLADAYDAAEVARENPGMRFDTTWDRHTGTRTRQVLATPILYEKYILGVLELANRRGAVEFDADEVAAAKEIARTLGIAFYNRRRMAPKRGPNKYGMLLDKGLLTEKSLEEAVAHARANDLDVASVLLDKHRVPKEELLRSLAAFYGCEHFLYDGTQRMPEDLKERLRHDYLSKLGIAPISRQADTVVVALEDPADLAKVDAVRVMQLASRQVVQVALPGDIQDYLDASYDLRPEASVDDILGELTVEVDEAPGAPAVAGDEERAVEDNEPAIVRLAGKIILDAFTQGASDIHIEPCGPREPARVRFRVDGECRQYMEIPPSHRQAIVSRLKIMAQLDISERRLPQDGKIRTRAGDRTIELRVATLPTAGGEEDMVLRILAASKPMPLAEMGFSERNRRVVEEALSRPYGIFLCVGPTGSGKTTTLHSCLGHINTPDMKIWTAEDPVEITQPGLRQLQVQPKIGLTFATAMRAFLRADPDVIMVGEMRDKETAEIAIEASLTGHLVFSTLHTNSAPETISRLLDMEIEPFNFADALLLIVAQRLARRLCGKCKQPYVPDDAELEVLAAQYGEDAFGAAGLGRAGVKLAKAVGCPACGGSGYKGRVGLHEALVGTDAVKRLVQKGASVEEIRRQAQADGMTTLMQDGIAKILQGVTDLQQVRAVCIK